MTQSLPQTTPPQIMLPQTLLIVEEALRDLNAHWFEYIKTITQSAQHQGYQVDVACHQNAVPDIQTQLNCFPIFRYARYLDNKTHKLLGERYYGFLLHSLRTLTVLWPLLSQRDRYTHVFAPTVLVHHLLMWWMIMRFHPQRPHHLTLFFVANPGIWDHHQQTAIIPRSPMVSIQRSLLRWFQPMIKRGTVRFAVETMGAKQEFETLTGLPFHLFPHPVPTTPISFRSVLASSQLLPTSSQPVPISSHTINTLRRSPSLRFACYGFARYEKGSDLLKAAIETIAHHDPSGPHFCIQWVDPFTTPDGHTCDPTDLNLYPTVDVIDHALASNDYQTALEQTSCMVLPYRNSSYHARLSRVAIEAVCLGIPIIYTKGGWLEDIVHQFGAGIGIQDEDVDELIAAIQTMTAQYSQWHQKAIARQETAQQYFSGDMFCHHLFHPASQTSQPLFSNSYACQSHTYPSSS